MQKPKGTFILPEESYHLIYSQEQVNRIGDLVDLTLPRQDPDAVRKRPEILREVELVFTGWGSLAYDAEILAAAPNLKVIFYGAGSVRGTATDDSWERSVRITSAWAANAVPVVEYTLAHIYLALKKAYQHQARFRQERRWVRLPVAGGYGSTVGLISLGMIGRMVAERLKTSDLRVIAYDPFVSHDDARRLNVEMVGLEEIFRRADVVSLHTPLLESTRGMIRGLHLALMKPNATFINTSRGAIVHEADMIEVLIQRPDLFAVLDVTWPEPPALNSPLFTLPNVFLTPHIAGAMSGECHRLGLVMVEELERYLQGQPLLYELTREKAAIMA